MHPRIAASLCAVLSASCATAPATPAPAALDEQVILARTDELIAAWDKADRPAVERMLAPRFLSVGRARLIERGFFLNRMDARAKLGFPRTQERKWEEKKVRFLGDTALVTGLTTATLVVNAAGKQTTQERITTLVWVQQDGAWQLGLWEQEDAGLEAERMSWNSFFRESMNFNTAPNKFLMESVRGVTPGKALDVGMGQGRNALYLASKGWQVTGVDIADEGVRQAQEVAKSEGLQLNAVVQDINTYDWGKEQWDLICFIYVGGGEHLDKIRGSLKKGGLVVFEYFHKDATQGMNVGGFKTHELDTLFKDGFKVLHSEVVEDVGDYGQVKLKLVRFVAQKI